MKKLVITLFIMILSVFMIACGQKKEESAEETPEQEKTVEIIDIKTPVPVIEEKEAVKQAAETQEEQVNPDILDPDKQLVKFSLGDGADVDYVMTEIVEKWDNTSVVKDEGNGVVTYYIIPKEKGKSKGDSIAYVKAYDDDYIIREVTATVFLDEADKHAEAVEKVYNYFSTDFPNEFIANFNKDAWNVLNSYGEMEYQKVSEELKNMKEEETERFEHGSFNFEIAVDSLSKSASFTFYSD